MHDWVRDLMSTTIVSCSKDTPIPDVAAAMSRHNVSAIIVIDEDGYLAGLITRTDLVVLRAYDEYWQAMQARHVMIRNVITTVSALLSARPARS
ncbi:MAG: CBS domain-containing protein [Anaerolineae bacterium]|nr:MAG: CBS domain-containing protein [Anaerolineae bacterium]